MKEWTNLSEDDKLHIEDIVGYSLPAALNLFCDCGGDKTFVRDSLYEIPTDDYDEVYRFYPRLIQKIEEILID